MEKEFLKTKRFLIQFVTTTKDANPDMQIHEFINHIDNFLDATKLGFEISIDLVHDLFICSTDEVKNTILKTKIPKL